MTKTKRSVELVQKSIEQAGIRDFPLQTVYYEL